MVRRALLFSLLTLLACGDDPPETPMADCVPSEDAYNDTIRALIEANCSRCHGVEPDFGAPFSLLSYGPLLEGVEGRRIVDDMVRELIGGTMPPPGSPAPTIDERSQLVEWASCGERTVEGPTGPSRPPFSAPAEAPPGLEMIDVRANALPVGPGVRDRYDDIDFTNLTDEDVFIRRFEAIVDESRVLHHLTLRRGDPAEGEINMKYLYAWAPGTGAIQFPEGGIRLRPGDNLRLQIHYNNGAGFEGITDSSGVRLFVGPTVGPEYEMFDPGPGAAGFEIAARSEATVESTCTIQENVQVLASMPHMHEIGTTFDVRLARDGGESESILALPTWSFETQLFYDLPVEFREGDELTIRCDYMNPRSEPARAGPRTEDEMCFAFTYVTPPPSVPFLCIPSAGEGQVTELEYEPGACFDEPVAELPTLGATIVATTEGPVFDGDAFPDGAYVLDRVILAADNPSLVSLATFTFAGQAQRSGTMAGIDSALHIVAPLDGLRAGDQSDIAFSGTLAETGTATLDIDCPAAIDFPMQFGTVGGEPAISFVPDGFPTPVTFWYVFRAAN